MKRLITKSDEKFAIELGRILLVVGYLAFMAYTFGFYVLTPR